MVGINLPCIILSSTGKVKTERRVYLYPSTLEGLGRANNKQYYHTFYPLYPILSHIQTEEKATMNRAPTLDPNILTIADLKEAACKDMPKMYRGKASNFPHAQGSQLLTKRTRLLQRRRNGSNHVCLNLHSLRTIQLANIQDRNSLKDNEAAFNRYKIRPRVLKNVANIDTATTIFGVEVCSFSSSPVLFNHADIEKNTDFSTLWLQPGGNAQIGASGW